ncbi:MAG: hypothetical protein ACREA0_15545, partial [bacterium]
HTTIRGCPARLPSLCARQESKDGITIVVLRSPTRFHSSGEACRVVSREMSVAQEQPVERSVYPR